MADQRPTKLDLWDYAFMVVLMAIGCGLASLAVIAFVSALGTQTFGTLDGALVVLVGTVVLTATVAVGAVLWMRWRRPRRH